jgi:hypothetical protein
MCIKGMTGFNHHACMRPSLQKSTCHSQLTSANHKAPHLLTHPLNHSRHLAFCHHRARRKLAHLQHPIGVGLRRIKSRVQHSGWLALSVHHHPSIFQGPDTRCPVCMSRASTRRSTGRKVRARRVRPQSVCGLPRRQRPRRHRPRFTCPGACMPALQAVQGQAWWRRGWHCRMCRGRGRGSPIRSILQRVALQRRGGAACRELLPAIAQTVSSKRCGWKERAACHIVSCQRTRRGAAESASSARS